MLTSTVIMKESDMKKKVVCMKGAQTQLDIKYSKTQKLCTLVAATNSKNNECKICLRSLGVILLLDVMNCRANFFICHISTI